MRSPLEILRLAINNFHANRVAFGTAVNVSPIGESEWLEFPYGESEYWLKERSGWKKYTQTFLRPQADKMVVAINSLREKKGAAWRGLPIFVGHPDADPVRWPDDKRLGGILELEAGEQAMRLRVAWNDEGEKNRDQGYYVYPSPAWIYDFKLAANTGQIIPDELRSVGLTNTPRIQDSPAWTNSESSLFEANNPANADQPEKEKHMDHKKMLLELLNKHHAAGLSAEAANEDIFTAYNTAMGKAPVACNALELPIGATTIALNVAGEVPADLLSNLTAINTEVSTLRTDKEGLITARDNALAANTASQADVTRFRTLATNSLLDAALNAGRITAADRAALASEFAADFDATATKLGAKRAALNTQRLDLNPGSSGTDLSTPGGRQIAFNSLLDEYQRPTDKGGKGFKSIDDALAAMRQVPEHKLVLDAMSKG
jgi:hypothetical protein